MRRGTNFPKVLLQNSKQHVILSSPMWREPFPSESQKSETFMASVKSFYLLSLESYLWFLFGVFLATGHWYIWWVHNKGIHECLKQPGSSLFWTFLMLHREYLLLRNFFQDRILDQVVLILMKSSPAVICSVSAYQFPSYQYSILCRFPSKNGNVGKGCIIQSGV